MTLFRVAAAALLLASAPAIAQLAPSDHAPTEPTANDPSVGMPSPPAADLKNPEGMSPQAARKEGTSPPTSGAAESAGGKH